MTLVLVAGCNSSDEGATSAGSTTAPSAAATIEAPDAAYEKLVRDAVRSLGANKVLDVRIAEPPKGFEGDLWAFVTVVGDDVSPLEANWQAGSLAGRLRAVAQDEGATPIFGYSIAYSPERENFAGAEQVLGEDIADPDAEPATQPDIEAAAEKLGLPVASLEFQGDDQTPVVRVQFDGPPEEAIERWEEIATALMGPKGTRWLVEVVDADGAPIRGSGDIPEAGARFGWVRPGLSEDS